MVRRQGAIGPGPTADALKRRGSLLVWQDRDMLGWPPRLMGRYVTSLMMARLEKYFGSLTGDVRGIACFANGIVCKSLPVAGMSRL
ncbi:hypothetical protein [Paracoccus aestuariivivens]|uniref:Uncharacterized protein n=1 Tax=Paracoccus aestuariivivens TaxID=1820333 RepID=A0A6L6JA13_9RHOB|nr:hypothetical protein [Paracoccus aestuariivivens]MTH78850.1 hypothetical protein [Paracoccus aestuariivivens]